MAVMGNEIKLFVGIPEGKNNSKGITLDRRILLEWI
jgi:hypothetical protein